MDSNIYIIPSSLWITPAMLEMILFVFVKVAEFENSLKTDEPYLDCLCRFIRVRCLSVPGE